MRILFIGTFLSKTRGTLQVSESVSRVLKESGYEVNLVSKIENKLLRLLNIINSSCFRKFDVAHIDVFSNNAFLIARISSFLLSLRGKKIVMTMHGGMLPEFYRLNVNVVNRVLNRASIIQTPSLYLKEVFTNQGNFKVRYLPNAVNIELFKCERDKVIPLSILWVRAFDKIYNPKMAILAFSKIQKEFPNAKLTMVGPDKGELEEVINLAKRLKLIQKISFLGPIANDKLPKLYQSHEVYINTTSYESFGVALVEAASCGVPIVSTDVGEIPYIWEDNKNMLLVKKNASDEMAAKVLTLFRNHKLAKAIAKAASENVIQFSRSKIYPKWKSLFNEMNHI